MYHVAIENRATREMSKQTSTRKLPQVHDPLDTSYASEDLQYLMGDHQNQTTIAPTEDVILGSAEAKLREHKIVPPAVLQTLRKLIESKNEGITKAQRDETVAKQLCWHEWTGVATLLENRYF